MKAFSQAAILGRLKNINALIGPALQGKCLCTDSLVRLYDHGFETNIEDGAI